MKKILLAAALLAVLVGITLCTAVNAAGTQGILVNYNFNVTGTANGIQGLSSLNTSQICIQGDCKTAWPTSSSGGSDGNMTGLASIDSYIIVTVSPNGTLANVSFNTTNADLRYALLSAFNTFMAENYANMTAQQALSILYSANDTALRLGIDSLNTTKGNLSAVNGSANQIVVYVNGTATYGVPQFLFTYVSGMGIHTFTGSSAGSAIYTAGSSGTFRGESSVMRIGGLNRPLELGTGASGVTPGILIDNTQNVAIGVPYSNSSGAWDKTSKLYVNGTVNITGNVAVDSNTLFVDATNDRVGIGNTAPNTTLHVSGGINVSGTGSNSIYQLTDGVSTMALWTTSLGFISEEGVARIVGANSNLTFHSGGTRNSMAQGTTQGQIGTDGWCVNCSDANATLYVVGSGLFTSTGEALELGEGANTATYMTIAGDRSFVGYDANSLILQGGTSKGIGFIVNDPSFDGTEAMTLQSDGDFLVDTDTIFIDAAGDKAGFNTSTPTSTLQVVGDANISGIIYATGTPCSSSQVLTTNPTTGALTCTTNTSLTAYANQSANFTCSAGQGLQSVAFNTDGTQNATGCFTPSGSGSGGNVSNFNATNGNIPYLLNISSLGESLLHQNGSTVLIGNKTKDTGNGLGIGELLQVSGDGPTPTYITVNDNYGSAGAGISFRTATNDWIIAGNNTQLFMSYEFDRVINFSSDGSYASDSPTMTIGGFQVLSTSTTFGGDVTGTNTSIQLAAGSVGAAEMTGIATGLCSTNGFYQMNNWYVNSTGSLNVNCTASASGLVNSTGITFTVNADGSYNVTLAITTGIITDDTILAADLDAVDSPADEECVTYESSNGGFEYQTCGSGGGSTIAGLISGNFVVANGTGDITNTSIVYNSTDVDYSNVTLRNTSTLKEFSWQGLVLYLDFDNRSMVNTTYSLDGSGFDNDVYALQPMSVTHNGSRDGGGALNYTGVGFELADIRNSPSLLHFPDDQATYSFWLKRDGASISGFPSIMQMDGGTGQRNHFIYYTASNGLISYSMGNGSATHDAGAINASAIPTGTWHHYVIVVDNKYTASTRGYIDGKLNRVQSITSIGATTGFLTNITANLELFGFSNGSIDDVMIFNRKLTEAEVYSLYEQGQKRESPAINRMGGTVFGVLNATQAVYADDVIVADDVTVGDDVTVTGMVTTHLLNVTNMTFQNGYAMPNGFQTQEYGCFETDLLGGGAGAGGGAFAPFYASAISSGTIAADVAGTNDHFGIASLQDSTTANGGAMIVSSTAAGSITPKEDDEVRGIMYIPSGKIATVTLRTGFLDTITSADATDGCFIEWVSPATATAKCRAAGATTSNATTYTYTNNTYYAWQVKHLTETTANFTIWSDAGAVLWSVGLSTGVNTAATNVGIVATQSTTDAASSILRVDYLGFCRTYKPQRGWSVGS